MCCGNAGDHIEALIGVADLAAAEHNLERLERQSLAVNRAWGLAVAGRCRALLFSARGDVPGAVAAIDDALEHHQRVPMPFEFGRTLLVAGTTRRRAKRHHDARRALTAAQSIFDRLGAPLWSAKTTTELARIGGRRPAPKGLTDTEHQVAQLVIAGRSNPEVAAELFMSRRTVEDHLSKIYRKVGVRSLDRTCTPDRITPAAVTATAQPAEIATFALIAGHPRRVAQRPNRASQRGVAARPLRRITSRYQWALSRGVRCSDAKSTWTRPKRLA